jgi:hypothetical protein
VISRELRRSFLELVPPATPALVVAPGGTELLALAQSEPALTARPFDDAADAAGFAAYVLLEGLDAHHDPAALLGTLRCAAPAARLFALVANGAYFPDVAAFAGGARIAPVRPLVRTEIEPLFAAGGWTVTDVAHVPDPACTPSEFPFRLVWSSVVVHADATVATRMLDVAFIVSAQGR